MQQKYTFKVVEFVKKVHFCIAYTIYSKSPFGLHLSFQIYNKKFITLYKKLVFITSSTLSYSIGQKVVLPAIAPYSKLIIFPWI